MLIFQFRYEGKPEDVLNPKKKQLEKITPVCLVCYWHIHGYCLSFIIFLISLIIQYRKHIRLFCLMLQLRFHRSTCLLKFKVFYVNSFHHLECVLMIDIWIRFLIMLSSISTLMTKVWQHTRECHSWHLLGHACHPSPMEA